MQNREEKELINAVMKIAHYLVFITSLVVCAMLIIITVLVAGVSSNTWSYRKVPSVPSKSSIIIKPSNPVATEVWRSPAPGTIPAGKAGDQIRYGGELIAHTANYFGPKGTIAQISNGMNCQNCHLDGGSRLFGNNFGGFIASYPKMSNRSGRVEPAAERIVECFNRSLGGKSPDTDRNEVRAMLAYMKWMGGGVKKGQKLYGSGTEKLPYLNVPANAVKGKIVFLLKCKSCHGDKGEGRLAIDQRSYLYPPLWGEHSYNDGAGMFRVINLAGFVKNNMPYGATYKSPQLTDQEAWDVAAFINSQPRMHRNQHSDWPDIKRKPIDLPFGPYADPFSEKQHKLGPFKPIEAFYKSLTYKNKNL
ncbi:c-type cytochrome [Mucilaginibacter xinganensis]|nr:c-type cytochrome [Mucilaginibacter xinganensis]